MIPKHVVTPLVPHERSSFNSLLCKSPRNFQGMTSASHHRSTSSFSRSSTPTTRPPSPTNRTRPEARPPSPHGARNASTTAAFIHEQHAKRCLLVHDSVWLIGSDRVSAHDINSGVFTHRLVLPPGSSLFTGAASAVSEYVWLGHSNGSIRIVHSDGRGQRGPAIRKHDASITDIAFCPCKMMVVSTDTAGLTVVWDAVESTALMTFSIESAMQLRLTVCSAAGFFLVWDTRRFVSLEVKQGSVATTDSLPSVVATDHHEVVNRLGGDAVGTVTDVEQVSEIWLTGGSVLHVLCATLPDMDILASIHLPLVDSVISASLCGSFYIAAASQQMVVVDTSTRSLLRDVRTEPLHGPFDLLVLGSTTRWRLLKFAEGNCLTQHLDMPSQNISEEAKANRVSPVRVPPSIQDLRASRDAFATRQECVALLGTLRRALKDLSESYDVAGSAGAKSTEEFCSATIAVDRAHQALLDSASKILTTAELDAWLSI